MAIKFLFVLYAFCLSLVVIRYLPYSRGSVTNGNSELSWSGVNIFVFPKETRSRAEPSSHKKSNVAVNIERCDEAMQRLKGSSRNLL